MLLHCNNNCDSNTYIKIIVNILNNSDLLIEMVFYTYISSKLKQYQSKMNIIF